MRLLLLLLYGPIVRLLRSTGAQPRSCHDAARAALRMLRRITRVLGRQHARGALRNLRQREILERGHERLAAERRRGARPRVHVRVEIELTTPADQRFVGSCATATERLCAASFAARCVVRRARQIAARCGALPARHQTHTSGAGQQRG